jgi:hypothetical protein
MKCKPYIEITLEIGTHLKTVKVTLNIFAVHVSLQNIEKTLFNLVIEYVQLCTSGLESP